MQNRVAIVTGGLTGIGLATAEALAAAGHRVAVCGRRGGDAALAERLRARLGEGCLIGAADVGDGGSVNQFVEQVRSELGPPTILVNAAGIYRETWLDQASDDDWYAQIDINLNGVYRMVRTVWGDMVSAGWGRIANVASTAGTKGAAGYAGYCASKAGVITLSKALAVEGAPHGISCISVSPTWVETPMMENAIGRISRQTGADVTQVRADIGASNPQGRLVQPVEVAGVIAYFCSDVSPALTNVDIQINAGADW